MPPTFRSWKTLPAKIKFLKPWQYYSLLSDLFIRWVSCWQTGYLSVAVNAGLCGVSEAWRLGWGTRDLLAEWMTLLWTETCSGWVCVMSTRLCGTKKSKNKLQLPGRGWRIFETSSSFIRSPSAPDGQQKNAIFFPTVSPMLKFSRDSFCWGKAIVDMSSHKGRFCHQ